MNIIMISGKSGSGKDTFANILKEKLSEKQQKVIIIHFADLVKFYAKKYYEWDGNKDEVGRSLLQQIGTTIMRNYNNRYWGDIVGQFLAAITPYNTFDVCLIPDWRFISEFEAICDYNDNVTTVRINRKDENGNHYINPVMTHEQYWHQSEIELDDFNFEWVIENTSKDLDNLCYAAEILIKEINNELF